MLANLLKDNPVYDERLAEQVLKNYLRVHHAFVCLLEHYGMDADDVEQELRIALWKHWLRYCPNPKTNLQSWLSWRMKHELLSMVRRARRRFNREVPLSVLLTEDLTDGT